MTGITLSSAANATVLARRTITTTAPASAVSFRIVVERDWVDVRFGTTAGGNEIVDDQRLEPGVHILTITPGAETYYVQASRTRTGVTVIRDFTRVSGVLEIDTPYSADSLRSLRFEQSGDVRWIFHRDYAWRAIERRGVQSWSLRAWRPNDGPFLPENDDTAHTMAASALVGEVLLSSSEDYFRDGHVGALMELRHQGQLKTETLTGADQWTAPIRVTGVEAGRVFQIAISGTFTATVTLQRSVGNDLDWTDQTSYTSATTTTFDDGFDNQIMYYRLGIKAGNYTSGSVTATLTFSAGETIGAVRVVSVENGFFAIADVVRPLGSTNATSFWAEGAWSSLRGWPAAGALFDGRLFLGRDRSVWGSAPDGYLTFEPGAEDDDAIARNIAIGEASPIVWLKGLAQLVVGTEAGEPAVRSTAFDEPLTPLNMTIRQRSSRGSADIDAVPVDTAALFVSRSKRRLIELSPSDGGVYFGRDLTRLHEDIAGVDGFVDACWQQEPEPRLWLARADGQVAVLTYNPAEGVVAFSRIVTDGRVESLACVPGAPEDSVYWSVVRTIGGVEKRFVERIQPERWTALADAWRVDAGLKSEGAATATLTGLSHLEGRTVRVWAEGAEHSPVVVSSGAVTLDRSVTKAIVGLERVARWRSLRLTQAGAALGEPRRVDQLVMLVHRSPRGALYAGRSFESLDRAPDFTVGFTMDGAQAVLTGEIEMPFDGENSSDPRICLTAPGAGPATLLSMSIRLAGGAS